MNERVSRCYCCYLSKTQLLRLRLSGSRNAAGEVIFRTLANPESYPTLHCRDCRSTTGWLLVISNAYTTDNPDYLRQLLDTTYLHKAN